MPSFVFIIFADIFFTIMSLFQGGIFRGWFAKKKPMTDARKGAFYELLFLFTSKEYDFSHIVVISLFTTKKNVTSL